MPSEVQLKAQMQAAIAKKKQEAEAKAAAAKKAAETTPEPEPQPEPESNSTAEQASSEAAPEPVTEPTAPPPAPIEEPPEEIAEETGPVTIKATPPALTFYNQPIRYQVEKQQVYFAVPDVLPLSFDHESHFKYLELRNNPATKEKVVPLIKTIVIENEKIDGATSANLLTLIHELGLSVPGPFGRWLFEVSESHKNDESKEL